MNEDILEYLEKDWHKMRIIKERFNITSDAKLRKEISAYNDEYDPHTRPKYIVSNIGQGYYLTTDVELINESADYHFQLAMVHLKKYWKVVKAHESRNNVILDFTKGLKVEE